MPGDIDKKNILLVDDICTTGTTLNTSAKILKFNGAKKIDIFALTSTENIICYL